MTDNHIAEGYYRLCGAIIRQAMDDYRGIGHYSYPGVRQFNREDAEDFLFTGRLEEFVKRFGIGGVVHPTDIREEAGKQTVDGHRNRWGINDDKPKRLSTFIPESKECNRCKEVLPADGFYVTMDNRGGTIYKRLKSQCKKCIIELNLKYKRGIMANDGQS